jgi:hypothetical protein
MDGDRAVEQRQVLEEVRKMNEVLDRQIQVLREGIEGLKGLPLGPA